MDTIESYIDQAVDILQKIAGLPAIALVAISCLVVGYVLRFFKRFPNDAIPVVVVIWGAVWYTCVADANNTIPLRVWLFRNVAIGLIIGCGTWLLHRYGLKFIETKIPILGPYLAQLDSPTVTPIPETPPKPTP